MSTNGTVNQYRTICLSRVTQSFQENMLKGKGTRHHNLLLSYLVSECLSLLLIWNTCLKHTEAETIVGQSSVP